MLFTNAVSIFLPLSAYFVRPIICVAIESIFQRDNDPRSSQTQLASGSAIEYGKVSNSLSWQASGPLYSGCNLSGVKISNCYQLTLSSDATQNLEDYGSSTPRQRTEFLTASAAAGTTHKYQWSYYLKSPVGTSTHFFHLMQLFSRDDGGPILTLDAINGVIAIKDNYRDCSKTGCPSIPLNTFTDKTTIHTIAVTYGPSNGIFKYIITDSATSEVLLSYSASGNMGGNASIKFGTYRLAVSNMKNSVAALGDFKVLA
ncbi:hypothetical protein EV368DRAFT_80721 [Lentinula lateritia]|uniref:Uncharacterized protein n=1 Tax=Lentinula aff. lateritia TaxID=2804960 RepID=A0ACC1U021_9AGAR|nr:hypothetical protein F5876DRAFT_65859 [Lentinula aff. lateritia]KAJ3854318.1 hypothetical protein EV368DRAFT_80721 [Lentinula lateritia]